MITLEIKPTIRNVIIAVSVVLLLFLLWYFKTIVIYLVSAGIVSLIGKPIVNFIQKFHYKKYRIPTPIAALIAIAIIIGIIVALAAVFIPLIFQQLAVLSQIDYAKISIALKDPIERINQLGKQYKLIDQNAIPADEYVLGQIKSKLNANFVLKYANSAISFVTHLFTAIVAISFMSFFFLQDEKMFFRIISGATPSDMQNRVMRVLEHCRILLSDYFIGLIKQNTVFAILIAIGLSIVGVKSAILIGFIAGILNFIPYVGAVIAGLIAIAMGFSESIDLNFMEQTLPKIGYILLVFALVMTLDHLVTSTYFASNNAQAHPIEIFIVILMGSQLAGILGMFLAIPMYSILRLVAKEFLGEFSVVQKLTHDLEVNDD